MGISICPELDVAAITEAAGGDKEKRAVALAQQAYKAVCSEYALLETAITQPEKRAGLQQFSQPFLAGRSSSSSNGNGNSRNGSVSSVSNGSNGAAAAPAAANGAASTSSSSSEEPGNFFAQLWKKLMG